MPNIGPDAESYNAAIRAGAPHTFAHTIEEWGFRDDVGRRKRRRVALVLFAMALLALGATLFLLVRVGGNNSHAVKAGQWYRAAQMNETDLARTIDERKIRTVLRLVGGDDSDRADYESDRRVCEKRGVNLVMAKMAASRLPWRSELSTLFAFLDLIASDAKMQPVLVHCSQGSDRTGLVSVIWLHDYQGAKMEDARGQLAFFPYMHVSWGEARSMGEFLDMFEAYARDHKGAKIRDWVREHYFEEKPGREIGKWYDGKVYAPRKP